ncbi:MAG TPA: hypothetical protein VMW39_06890 [bacterium]|nr:hypothetical protein [bacterium]
MIKYILLLSLLLTTNLCSYIAEELSGVWGNVDKETFISFDGFGEGNFIHHTGGNFSNVGKYKFKGKTLTLNYEYIENAIERRRDEFTEKYVIELGFLNSGLRYLKLHKLNKKEYLGPYYFRNR